jgi:hypothetical protein
MKRTVGRVLANPVVRKAVIVAISDVIYLYAKAFINVVTRKMDAFVDEKERAPQVVEVTLED